MERAQLLRHLILILPSIECSRYATMSYSFILMMNYHLLRSEKFISFDISWTFRAGK